MKIIEPSFPNEEESKSILGTVEASHGFGYISKISWETIVVHEIRESTNEVLGTVVKSMSPGLTPGDLVWAAIPDPGCRLVIDRGPWVEPRGEITFRSGVVKAVNRGCNPAMSAFFGAMACMAFGYKLVGRDGADYGIENAGNVFSWAAIAGKDVAQAIRKLQRVAEAEAEMAERLAVDSAFAKLLEKAEEVFGEDVSEKLLKTRNLSETLLVPQYAEALKTLLELNCPVREARINFRPITGVWVIGEKGQAAKQTVLDAYAAIRWL